MKTQYILTLVSCFCALNAWSQTKSTQKADQLFERYDYVDAIKAYQKLAKKGKANAYVYNQLAEANFKVSDFENAERYYKRFLRNKRNASAEDYYNYAQVLLLNKKYADYKKTMLDFAEKAPSDSRAKAFLENSTYLEDLQAMQPRFELTAVSLNSKFSDFGGYTFQDKFYFVSSRNQTRKTYDWTKEPTLDLFVADNTSGILSNTKEVKGDINTNFHEGTVAITKDGSTLYFTRNDYLNGNYRKDDAGVNHLKIYKASLVNGQFQDVQDLSINAISYSNANPTLSPDERQLYFSSDRPGGYGASDLYMVDIEEDGSLGEPKNLGGAINTEARENFPFMDQDHILYFSSDGHLGVGGLDVYYTKSTNQGFLPPQNLGLPLNSNADDFAFTYNSKTQMGFVSSNRVDKKEAKPIDNIYKAKLVHPLKQTSILAEVVDLNTDESIQNAQVIFYDEEQNEYSRSSTKPNGLSNNFLPTGQTYVLQVNREGYKSQSMPLEIPETQMLVKLALEPEMTAAEAEMLILQERIFFDYDKADIKPESALELDKLITILNENPDIKVKVVSHTDERGSKAYNLKLSQKRADNTVNYLVENGIEASRLTSEGKGKTEPINTCESDCTEAEHEENRRSEFMVVE